MVPSRDRTATRYLYVPGVFTPYDNGMTYPPPALLLRVWERDQRPLDSSTSVHTSARGIPSTRPQAFAVVPTNDHSPVLMVGFATRSTRTVREVAFSSSTRTS